MEDYLSWGRWPRVVQSVRRMEWRSDPLPDKPEGSLLPRGLGRSYGDSCLNADNVLLDARGLNRFIQFDAERGILRCEGGVSFDAILRLIVPRGWFLPVVPGTKFITIAGAVANDIHGKNHHTSGTFGCHVTAFELLRSDGNRLVCAPDKYAELFRATIGGLGLTGLITWVEVSLLRIRSAWIDMQTVRFGNLAEFFPLSAESNETFDYTVAWVDFTATGKATGRGHFMRGNHSERGNLEVHRAPKVSVPLEFPNWVLNPISIRLFNIGYYHRQLSHVKQSHSHYEPFYFPLDLVGDWNRIYGRRGFFQYQCVVPFESDLGCIQEIVSRIARSQQGSFLAVLKTFGKIPSPGLLSFPQPGVTVALDFSHSGGLVLELMAELDRVVESAGGRLYPAKDARMSAAGFQRMYPQWREFSNWIDPAFSSSFWRRVTSSSVSG